MKTAVVVLATGEYRRGARVLFSTLRRHGKLPGHVTPIALGVEDCDWAESTSIVGDYSWVPVSQKNFPRVADKFFALTLPYDRIIMIDADVLCVGDCSYLWSELLPASFYACRDTASVVYYRDSISKIGLNPDLLFNAGVMVFHRGSTEGLMGLIERGELETYDGGDQGYLNHYFQRYSLPSFLPPEYNCCLDPNMPQVPEHARRLIHFTGSNANPWHPTDIEEDDWRQPMLKRWRTEEESL